VAAAGKTLCLLDGTYTGYTSMILPPKELNGASGIPITIRALNDGKVLINGLGGLPPVQLSYNDWFVIEGINACCSNTSVVSLSNSSSNVIRRVAAWDAADKNTNIFGAHYGSHNLFEDVAGWGRARKIFSMSQGGDFTTVRRAWGRWERSTVVGPKLTYSLAYNSYHMTCEFRRSPGGSRRWRFRSCRGRGRCRAAREAGRRDRSEHSLDGCGDVDRGAAGLDQGVLDALVHGPGPEALGGEIAVLVLVTEVRPAGGVEDGFAG
jgi:hypothetical protein